MDDDLKTDDAGRNLAYSWYGPADMPFPWQARLSTQVGTGALVIVSAVILWMLVPGVLLDGVPLLNQTAAKVLVVLAGAMTFSLLASVIIAPKVTKDRPLSYWFQVLQDEMGAPRKADQTVRTPQGFLVIPDAAWNPRKVNSRVRLMSTDGIDYPKENS